MPAPVAAPVAHAAGRRTAGRVGGDGMDEILLQSKKATVTRYQLSIAMPMDAAMPNVAAGGGQCRRLSATDYR